MGLWYGQFMNVKLTPEHEAWIRRELAAGRFTSIEQAVGTAVERFMMQEENPEAFEDDLEWAKPLIAEGIADADAGRLKTPEQVMERVRAHLRAKA
jgi:predicted transcriptional regulator